jgi:hypothetical protein
LKVAEVAAGALEPEFEVPGGVRVFEGIAGLFKTTSMLGGFSLHCVDASAENQSELSR